ncbi:IclR family transcriptional regulator [Paenibacillus alkalitolerans]|uniref:IclR family transcriptional regulator n=1 Tax=Paenibacillus alkalitolerans TaxID=2799335 RepID=UPI0018F5F9B3|nr:IclR family transcriptional regulator [Paenibacillus alkalitolerans]
MSDVLDKAVKILHALSPSGEEKELSATQISRELEIPVQSAHRLLNSLKKHGFVQKDKETKKYRLGFAFLEFGFLVWNNLSFRAVARPFMEQLAAKTQESVYLSMRCEDEGVYVDAVDSPQILRVSEPIGLRLPLCVGASNRIILAYLPEKTQQQLLAKTDWSRVPCLKPLSYELVMEDLRSIRRLGYSVTTGEATESTTGIAAPIFSFDNRVIGGISVAGPASRFTPRKISEISFQAIRTAREISSELGWRNRGKQNLR